MKQEVLEVREVRVLLERPHYLVPRALFDEGISPGTRLVGRHRLFPEQLLAALRGAREELFQDETDRFSLYRVGESPWIRVILEFEPGLSVPGRMYVGKLELHVCFGSFENLLVDGEWAGLWMPVRRGDDCCLVGLEGPIAIGNGESIHRSLRAKLSIIRAGIYEAVNDGWLRIEPARYGSVKSGGHQAVTGTGPRTFLERVLEDGQPVGDHHMVARRLG